MITSKCGMQASQAMGLFPCRHVVVPTFCRSRHVGIRTLVWTANQLVLASVALRTILEIKKNRVEALMTIVQGRYYIAAAFAAWVTATPHVVMVHDRFDFALAARPRVFKTVLRYLTRTILRSAAHIYAVSPAMQTWLRTEWGVGSEVQLPSTRVPSIHARAEDPVARESGPIILFAGSPGFSVRDSLDLLATLIVSGAMRRYGLSDAKLHLCTAMTDTQMQARGWDNPNIICRGWVSQCELSRILSSADILFLPYTFLEDCREIVETAFPSKIADYLAASKPILVFGPRHSTLVRYASQEGFAEIVDEFSAAALARSIHKIASSPSYREKLAATAFKVLSANHDISCQQQKLYIMLERVTSASRRKADFQRLKS